MESTSNKYLFTGFTKLRNRIFTNFIKFLNFFLFVSSTCFFWASFFKFVLITFQKQFHWLTNTKLEMYFNCVNIFYNYRIYKWCKHVDAQNILFECPLKRCAALLPFNKPFEIMRFSSGKYRMKLSSSINFLFFFTFTFRTMNINIGLWWGFLLFWDRFCYIFNISAFVNTRNSYCL